jgi:hypothetical protein
MGLNATVTPGITVTSSTVLSAANLNLLGTPTVSITGSIDSSDIGDNTIDSNQIVNGAVDANKIGNIGGANYILKGVDSSSSIGIKTVAENADEVDQISLLVNDTSSLKARYITGSLDVTADAATNTLGLTIKDDIVTSGMIQDSAFSGRIRIGDIQPGGGVGNGGVGSTNSAAKTGGLLVFDPSSKLSIDGSDVYGKAVVLQPSGPNQFLKSDSGGKGGLEFGTITGQADGYVSAYADTAVGAESTSPSGAFTKIMSSNVHSLKFQGTRGVIRVYFEDGQYSNGDTVNVMGYGISDSAPDSHFDMAVASSTVATEAVNGTDYKYIDVTFIHHKGFNGHPDSNSASTRNPNFINLQIYS